MADAGWHTQLDGYCERLDPSFWSEPANAITNLSFIVAAVVAASTIKRDDRIDWGLAVLVTLVMLIGIGSFLFHTFATRWAALADVLPITLFILAYLALTLRRGFGLPWWIALGVTILFLPASRFIITGVDSVTAGILGGSVGYAPALLALVTCGLLLLRSRPSAGQGLLIASALFLVSLTFRTIDEPLCQAFPLGTHFMWHILNGVLLGFLVVRHAKIPLPVSARA